MKAGGGDGGITAGGGCGAPGASIKATAVNEACDKEKAEKCGDSGVMNCAKGVQELFTVARLTMRP